MRKINFELCFKIGLIAICVVNIFTAFFPMISFEAPYENATKIFALDGMSLLVDNGKAVYWDMYNTIVYENLEFIKSPTFISAFSLNVMILFLTLFSMFIKSKFNLDKFIFPLTGILCLVNVICSSMVFSLYQAHEIQFFLDYGLILFILFASLEFVMCLGINFISFYNKKKEQH